MGANIIPGVPVAAGRDEGTGAVAENRASGPAAVARGGEMAPWEERSVPHPVAVSREPRNYAELPGHSRRFRANDPPGAPEPGRRRAVCYALSPAAPLSPSLYEKKGRSRG